MTQEQLNIIVKLIQSGAPALAPELLKALSDLVTDYTKLKEEKDAVKAEEVKGE